MKGAKAGRKEPCKPEPSARNKIYSLHEPQVYCLAKGKEHKKHEFGSKASVVMTKTHGVIVGAVAHEKNLYDGDALPAALQQTEAITVPPTTKSPS